MTTTPPATAGGAARTPATRPPVGETVIGVVIEVPEPHASLLSWWRRKVGDPHAFRVWPHITLVPPTTVAAETLDAVGEHLRAAAATVEPFVVHLSGTGTFRPISPVVFVQVATGLAHCELLERAVRSGPVQRRLEFPYHPHVTVAHDVPEARLDQAYDALSGFTARFPVGSFQLFERPVGEAWRKLEEFPLGRSGTAAAAARARVGAAGDGAPSPRR